MGEHTDVQGAYGHMGAYSHMGGCTDALKQTDIPTYLKIPYMPASKGSKDVTYLKLNS